MKDKRVTYNLILKQINIRKVFLFEYYYIDEHLYIIILLLILRESKLFLSNNAYNLELIIDYFSSNF